MPEDNPTRMLILKIKAVKNAIPDKKKKLNDQIATVRSEMKRKILKLENEKSGLEDSANFEMVNIVREFEKTFRFDSETEKMFTKFRPPTEKYYNSITIVDQTQFNVVMREDGRWHLDFAWSAGGCESGGYQRKVSLDECLQDLTMDLQLLNKFINSSISEKVKFLE